MFRGFLFAVKLGIQTSIKKITLDSHITICIIYVSFFRKVVEFEQNTNLKIVLQTELRND